MIKVGVVGASGYTGTECVRFLAQHPHVSHITVFANTLAGTSTQPCFGKQPAISSEFLRFSPTEAYDIDVLFLAIPHKTSHTFMADLSQHSYRVIDLSADFRLQSAAAFEEHYGVQHETPSMLADTPYGLAEFNAESIKAATCVANPGCFAIASILALKPFTDKGMVKHVTIDAKTGVSGAGKAVNEAFIYCEVNEMVRAYNTNQHRHMAELAEQCGDCSLTFSPHLVPMNRGILAACYIETHDPQTPDSVHALYEKAYADSPFISIYDASIQPSTKAVVGSNMCALFIAQVSETRSIVFSAIDNLIKGAAGNAIQLMNIMVGFSETAGLPQIHQRV